jgi:hypothetical protein
MARSLITIGLARPLVLVSATLAAFTVTIVGFSGRPTGSAPASTGEPPCKPMPAGATERAADRIVERFLRLAVVQGRASCDEAMGIPGLEHPRYATRMPGRVAGWWQLAPRIRNANGLWEYAGFMWIDAPDAPPAAYEFLLELHAERWLVSSFAKAPGSAEIVIENAPT